jgi:hypothetical protein
MNTTQIAGEDMCDSGLLWAAGSKRISAALTDGRSHSTDAVAC